MKSIYKSVLFLCMYLCFTDCKHKPTNLQRYNRVVNKIKSRISVLSKKDPAIDIEKLNQDIKDANRDINNFRDSKFQKSIKAMLDTIETFQSKVNIKKQKATPSSSIGQMTEKVKNSNLIKDKDIKQLEKDFAASGTKAMDKIVDDIKELSYIYKKLFIATLKHPNLDKYDCIKILERIHQDETSKDFGLLMDSIKDIKNYKQVSSLLSKDDSNNLDRVGHLFKVYPEIVIYQALFCNKDIMSGLNILVSEIRKEGITDSNIQFTIRIFNVISKFLISIQQPMYCEKIFEAAILLYDRFLYDLYFQIICSRTFLESMIKNFENTDLYNHIPDLQMMYAICLYLKKKEEKSFNIFKKYNKKVNPKILVIWYVITEDEQSLDNLISTHKILEVDLQYWRYLSYKDLMGYRKKDHKKFLDTDRRIKYIFEDFKKTTKNSKQNNLKSLNFTRFAFLLDDPVTAIKHYEKVNRLYLTKKNSKTNSTDNNTIKYMQGEIQKENVTQKLLHLYNKHLGFLKACGDRISINRKKNAFDL